MHPVLGDLDTETGEPSGTIEREVDMTGAEKQHANLVDDPWQSALDEVGNAYAHNRRAASAAPATTPKSYCESCGGVDQHMPGCPTLRPPPEERFADFTSPRRGALRRTAVDLLKRLVALLE